MSFLWGLFIDLISTFQPSIVLGKNLVFVREVISKCHYDLPFGLHPASLSFFNSVNG
jgi:hypothetical protein